MTVSPSVSATHPTIPAPSSTAPLVLWLSLQLGVILVAVARLPLAAKYPDAGEQLTPQLLLPAQVVVASLLFPWLLGGVRRSTQVIATALPFQFASGYLAGSSIADLAPAMGLVAAWLVSLTGLAAILTSSRAQASGVASATCLTLGGGILRYLRLEFAPETVSPTNWETLSPLPSTLAALRSEASWSGFVPPIVILSTMGLWLGFLAWRHQPRPRTA